MWRPAILVVGAAVTAAFPAFSLGAYLGFALLVAATWLLRPRRSTPLAPTRLTRAAAWWAVPVVGFAALEGWSLAHGSSYAHPTLSVLVAPALQSYPVRFLAYLGWLAVLHTLVRRWSPG